MCIIEFFLFMSLTSHQYFVAVDSVMVKFVIMPAKTQTAVIALVVLVVVVIVMSLSGSAYVGGGQMPRTDEAFNQVPSIQVIRPNPLISEM